MKSNRDKLLNKSIKTNRLFTSHSKEFSLAHINTYTKNYQSNAMVGGLFPVLVGPFDNWYTWILQSGRSNCPANISQLMVKWKTTWTTPITRLPPTHEGPWYHPNSAVTFDIDIWRPDCDYDDTVGSQHWLDCGHLIYFNH